MAERIRVTVQASPKYHHDLPVDDAMRQVLAFFELLPDHKPGDDLFWAVANVTMASPFTVEAVAKSLRPNVDVSLQALRQKEGLDKRLRDVQRGRMPSDWAGTKRAHIALEILKRNANGVGKTEVDLDVTEAPLVFDEKTAEQSLVALAAAPVHRFKAHNEVGSIEGHVISVGLFRGEPAMRVRDRRNAAEVVCIVPPELHDAVVHDVDIDDVWRNSRVSVHGGLYYDNSGRVYRVDADRISKTPEAHVSLEDLYDTDFTEGLEPDVYLEQWREGA